MGNTTTSGRFCNGLMANNYDESVMKSSSISKNRYMARVFNPSPKSIVVDGINLIGYNSNMKNEHCEMKIIAPNWNDCEKFITGKFISDFSVNSKLTQDEKDKEATQLALDINKLGWVERTYNGIRLLRGEITILRTVRFDVIVDIVDSDFYISFTTDSHEIYSDISTIIPEVLEKLSKIISVGPETVRSKLPTILGMMETIVSNSDSLDRLLRGSVGTIHDNIYLHIKINHDV